MQTFLPYPDFRKSASVLDNKRLGKQRVECLQILKALSSGPYQKRDGNEWVSCSTEQYQPYDHNHRKTPWYNHPAVKMWKTHRVALAAYGMTVCDEWVKRGFNDTCKYKIEPWLWWWGDSGNDPLFVGNESFHASHRSNLLRKDPVHYGKFGWTEPSTLPYIWPV